MDSIKEVEEEFHRPRLAAIAEHLLSNTKFKYEFFSPPAMELYLLQVHLDKETIVSINYLPVELDEQLPYLFLQMHYTIVDDIKISSDLREYILFANNNTVLSSFHIENNEVYIKTVITQNPDEDPDFEMLMFNLGVLGNNLIDHQKMMRAIASGKMSFTEAVKEYEKMRE